MMKLTRTERKILDYVLKHGKVTPTIASKITGIKVSSARTILYNMARMGVLKRISRGVYTWRKRKYSGK